MTIPPVEGGSVVSNEQDPVKAALALLDLDVWSISSVPGVITVVRRWSDNSTDTIVILSPATSYARRDDHRARLVWSAQGTVTEVVPEARDLPAPGQPDAPREVVPERLEPDL